MVKPTDRSWRKVFRSNQVIRSTTVHVSWWLFVCSMNAERRTRQYIYFTFVNNRFWTTQSSDSHHEHRPKRFGNDDMLQPSHQAYQPIPLIAFIRQVLVAENRFHPGSPRVCRYLNIPWHITATHETDTHNYFKEQYTEHVKHKKTRYLHKYHIIVKVCMLKVHAAITQQHKTQTSNIVNK